MSESIPPLRVISTGSGNYIPVFELELDQGSVERVSPIRVKFTPNTATADTSAIVYASTGASYITVSAEAGLAGDRVLTAGSSVILRSDATTVWIDATTANALAYAKTNLPIVIYSANAGSPIALTLSGGYSVSVSRTDASSIYVDATTGNATQFASSGGSFIVYSANLGLSNERVLTAGSSTIIRTDATAIYIDATTFDATTLKTYAATGGPYLTYSADTVLSVEKVITAGSSITLRTDATAFYIDASTANATQFALTGGNYIVFVADAGLSNEKVLTAGSSTTIRTDATTIWIDALTNGGASVTYAPTGGSYITFVADANLSSEKVLTAGSSTTIVTDATTIWINALTNAAGGGVTYASTGGPYLTYSADTVLTGEKTITAGSSTTIHTDATAFYINATTQNAIAFAGTGSTFVLWDTEQTWPNDKKLTAGSSVTIHTDATAIYINATTGGGGGTGNTNKSINLSIAGIKLDSANCPGIDGGPVHWRLNYDDTTQENGRWIFSVPKDYGSNPQLRIYASLASANSGTVAFETTVMAVTPGDSQDVDISNYDAANTMNVSFDGVASGNLVVCTIPIVKVDTMTASDYLAITLARDADATYLVDTATGDCEVRHVVFEYTEA